MEPNYAVAPGEYLKEWIDDEGKTQGDVASLLSTSRKTVNALIHGRIALTEDMALRLERVTHIPAKSWLTFEAGYREDLARLHSEEVLAAHIDKIDPTVATYLRKHGHIKANKRNPGRLVAEFLTFHQVGTFEAYEAAQEECHQGEYALAALKEAQGKVFPLASLPTWLHIGELTEEYERGRTFEFSAEALREALPDLKARAARPDDTVLTDLAVMLADVGVVLIFVEPPMNFPLHGVTRWINCRVPVIQQTGRQKRDGFILWTLFHEIGHILNDPRGEMHLEYTNPAKRETAAEKGANKFAWETLFGPAELRPFRGLKEDRDIARVAAQVGISPGVAVARMHQRRQLDRDQGHRLTAKLVIPFSQV